MATFLACPGAGTRRSAPALAQAAGEVGMRQRLALIAVEENDVAGFRLLFSQLQAQADPFDLSGDLAALQRVPRPTPM